MEVSKKVGRNKNTKKSKTEAKKNKTSCNWQQKNMQGVFDTNICTRGEIKKTYRDCVHFFFSELAGKSFLTSASVPSLAFCVNVTGGATETSTRWM